MQALSLKTKNSFLFKKKKTLDLVLVSCMWKLSKQAPQKTKSLFAVCLVLILGGDGEPDFSVG